MSDNSDNSTDAPEAVEPEAAAAPAKPSAGKGGGKDAGNDGSADEASPPRSPRQVRAAARILHKEASRILKKFGGRVAAEPAAQMRECLTAIETLRERQDWRGLQTEAERLDELLEQHADFARKSALRETVENIAIAVLIALGLRSCLYEPFKIPSGSMMPTLRKGDHIFVNKFVYGVQIPFTTTVVGESLGTIVRGDVVVFRFPLDETQDFIKRVVGLPGDEIKVRGRQVSIKRAGESEFSELPRERLEERCYDETGKKPVANCTLYRETAGDHTYVVRYRLQAEERSELSPPERIWKVPEGHLMVMGDNRNDSLDSRRWEVEVEAVKADGLLTTRDLRDLTDERSYSMVRADTLDEQANYSHDHVIYRASHRSPAHDLGLEVWREPSLGAEAVFAAKTAVLDNAEAMEWTNLVGPGQGAEHDGLLRHGEDIAKLQVGGVADARMVVVRLTKPQAVVALSCGREVCADEPTLARQLGEVLDRFGQNRGREARELLVHPSSPSTNYSSQFKSRHNPRDHFYERRFASAEATGPRAQVRLRAFRRPDEGVALVRDAALRHVGIEPDGPDAPPAQVADDTGAESWVLDGGDQWTTVIADTARDMVVVFECGKAVCEREARARELSGQIQQRMPRAAGDRRRMPGLLGVQDLDGLPETPTARPELAAYDRVTLEATAKGEAHSVELEAWLSPEGGAAAKVQELQQQQGLTADDAALDGAYGASTEDGIVFVFPVEATDTVVRMSCRPGLCASREPAVALARRAANRAADRDNFIDPEAKRPQPFVPRGNVKGRADRIWLPISRFWLAVR